MLHAKPASRLPSHVYQTMLERLNADLRVPIQEGIAGGLAIPAADVFTELDARYAEPATKPSDKRTA